MALYTVRSERMLCEQIEYNLLFRWFLDMNMDEATFDPTTFTKNRQRLLEHDVAYSGRIRAPIPAGPGHRFRNDAGAKSGAIRALIPV